MRNNNCYISFCLLSLFLFITSTIGIADPYYSNIDSLKNIISKGSPEQQTESLLNLSNEYLKVSLDSSKVYAQKAYNIAKSANDIQQMADAYRLLGNIYYYSKNYNIVLAHYDSSLLLYNQTGDSAGIDKVINNLGLLYGKVGSYKKSMKFHFQSLNYNLRKDNTYGIFRSYNNIGSLYYEMNDYGKSGLYFNKALKFLPTKNRLEAEQIIMSNLGLVAQELKQYDKSSNFFQKSLELAKQTNNQNNVADTYNNIGKSNFELGKYSEALRYYNLALDIQEEIGTKSSKTLNNIGQLYIELNYYHQAVKFLKKALNIAKENNQVVDLPKIYNNLSIAYEYLGNYKKAYSHYIQYTLYKDSLDKQSYEANMDRISKILKIGQKEKEIEKINFENKLSLEHKDNQIHRKNIIIKAYSIGVIIILVFASILLWLLLQKKKANSILTKQNEEILRADKIIHKKNFELIESEKRFKQIVEEIPVMIDAYDKDGTIALWNKQCEKTTGYSAEEIIGNNEILLKLYPNQQYSDTEKIQPPTKNKAYSDVPTILTCKDGSQKIITWSSVSSLVPIEGWNQWAIGIDVTEKRIAQQVLQKSEETLKGIFNSSPYGIILIDLEMNIIDGNLASFEMFRVTDKSEVIGNSFTKFIDPSHIDRVRLNIQEAIIIGFNKSNQYVFKRIDGTSFTAETSGSSLHDSTGKIIAFVSIINDITERIQFIEKLKHAKIDAEEADRLKTAFLANMSHEIRTPMNSIVGFSSLLAEPDVTEELKQKYLNHIMTSSNSLLNLIDDIIDVSKIEAGQLKITKQECNINNLLTELYSSFSTSNQKKNIEFFLGLPEKKEEFSFISDPLRIRQVFTNLISNAIKFTESGSIEIGFNLIKKKDQTFVEFYVSDTGIGIPEDKLEMIFHRFLQVEDAHTKKYRGTGLGLTISQRIVELLGGNIQVKSEIHKGSTFSFTLPFKSIVPAEKEATEPFQASKYNWKGKTLMIVEDEDSNYQLLMAALDRTQISILRARDGSESVKMFKETSIIDLILMDIRMPIMNGYEATRKIKAMDKNVPIISITAYAMSEDGSKSLAAGCDSYMSKPIRPGKLLAAINKYLK